MVCHYQTAASYGIKNYQSMVVDLFKGMSIKAGLCGDHFVGCVIGFKQLKNLLFKGSGNSMTVNFIGKYLKMVSAAVGALKSNDSNVQPAPGLSLTFMEQESFL